MNCIVCDESMDLIKTDVHKCTECNHIFIDYKDNGLDYHKNEYRKNGQGNRTNSNIEIVNGVFTNEFHKVRDRIMSKRVKLVKKYTNVNLDSSILDIGAGGGTFAKKMKSDLGIEIEVQEISDICINNLIMMKFNVHKGDFSEIKFDKQYDLVTCWHALEHIKDLHSYAENLSEVTKDICILEVPINRSLKEPNNGNWDGHYHFFTEKSMTKLFGKYFSSLEFSTTESVQQPALLTILKK